MAHRSICSLYVVTVAALPSSMCAVLTMDATKAVVTMFAMETVMTMVEEMVMLNVVAEVIMVIVTAVVISTVVAVMTRPPVRTAAIVTAVVV